ncbi:MAG: ATP-binding protein [Candidatus Thorarchaeota archaeon]
MEPDMPNLGQTELRLIETIPEGVVIVDSDGMIVKVNGAFASMIQRDEKSLVSTPFEDLLVTSNDGERFRQVLKGDLCGMLDVRLLAGRGSNIAVKLSTIPITLDHASQQSMMMVISDVTDFKRKEFIQEQQRKLLRVYTQLLQHDVMNDVQVVLSYIESVLDLSQELPQTARTMLEAARSAALRMVDLVRTFDDADQLTETSLTSLLEKTIDDASKAHLGMEITLEVPDSLIGVRVMASPLLPTAFYNLFRNAYQHGGKDARVTVTVERENGTMKVTVSDNGPGITPDARKTLFTRGTGRSSGGLGLYLTKRIIVSCGGSIELVDREGQGATFDIRLPIVVL